MNLKLKEQLLKYCYYFSLGCTFLLLAFYCFIFIQYSTNAPYFDDFFWGFTFLDEYIATDSIFEKLRLIFQQHAQHRIAYFRLFIVGHYHLLGTVNFKNLVIIGNLSHVVTFLVIAYLLWQKKSLRLLVFPIALIFFQFQFYQNIVCTYGFPNMAVYMWAISAFYCLTLATNRAFYLMLIFAIMSVFSNGNGILSFPIILYFLFLQKRTLHLKIASLIFVVFIAVYFTTADDMAPQLMLSIKRVTYFFKFLSAAFYTGHKTIELVAAVAIVLFFTVKFLIDSYQIIFKNLPGSNPQIWVFSSSVLIWIIGTALSVAVYRGSSNIDIPNWYFNYSVLLIVFATIFVLIQFKNKYLKALFLMGLMVYSSTNYLKNFRIMLPTIQVFHSNLKADMINFHNNQKWSFLLTQVSYPMYKKFEVLSNKFYDKGIYKPIIQENRLLEMPKEEDLKKGNFKYKLTASGEHQIGFEAARNKLENSRIKSQFGFIKSTANIYYFGVMNPINPSCSEMLSNLKLFGGNSYYVIDKTYFDIAIQKGEYQFGMAIIDEKDQLQWYISDQKVKIENY
ncbi:MAG: hypothetical protein V4683_03595 [Bacteroidota bacterium]